MKFVPVIVTFVPPAVLPLVGLMLVTVGALLVTVRVKVCGALVSTPPLAVPPLSMAVTVTVATPGVLPGVKVSVPSLAIAGWVVKRALLLLLTWNASV